MRTKNGRCLQRLLLLFSLGWWYAFSSIVSPPLRDEPTDFRQNVMTAVEGIVYVMEDIDLHGFYTRNDDVSYQLTDTEYSQEDHGQATRSTEQLSRIIGGGDAQKGRYPYLASITYERSHTCGGTLIADDIILSAAHCWEYFDGVELGRHNVADKNEDFERYNIEKFVKHPQYKDAAGSFDNDFMIAKLYGWSKKQTIAINRDAATPGNSGEELHVMGWGVTNTATKQPADILKDVSVNYMSNNQCRSKKGKLDGFSQLFSLEGRITSNMMCAADVGEDACQGDSGGPLISKKLFSKHDLQVGVVSWGLGCADPVFPGIYARISSQSNWIIKTVCDWAEKPPAYFGCTPRPDPTPGPTRPVTIEIKLDRFPGETGWLVRRADGKTVSYIPIGGYKNAKENHVISVMQLEMKKSYTLTMLDGYGDGIKFDGGFYKLWMGDTPYIDGLITSGSTYGKSHSFPFYVPELAVAPPTPSIAVGPGPGPAPGPGLMPGPGPSIQQETPAPTDLQGFYITIGIKFDDYPEEIGWALTSVETQELLSSKKAGSYKGKKNDVVVEKILLPENASKKSQFIFAILDNGRDGLCCEKGQGFYQVFYGNMADNKVLFQGDEFKYIQQFIFGLRGDVITPPPVLRLDEDDEVGPTDSDVDDDYYSADDDTYSEATRPLPIPLYFIYAIIGIMVLLL